MDPINIIRHLRCLSICQTHSRATTYIVVTSSRRMRGYFTPSRYDQEYRTISAKNKTVIRQAFNFNGDVFAYNAQCYMREYESTAGWEKEFLTNCHNNSPSLIDGTRRPFLPLFVALVFTASLQERKGQNLAGLQTKRIQHNGKAILNAIIHSKVLRPILINLWPITR